MKIHPEFMYFQLNFNEFHRNFNELSMEFLWKSWKFMMKSCIFIGISMNFIGISMNYRWNSCVNHENPNWIHTFSFGFQWISIGFLCIIIEIHDKIAEMHVPTPLLEHAANRCKWFSPNFHISARPGAWGPAASWLATD